MHPFALNDDALDQVGGGDSRIILIGGIIANPLTPAPKLPIEATTLAIGEEGGGYVVPELA
ncbi:hypothetical protein [Massilia sp. ST3]|uniref:hypothetical protein n=1 Tax=Massilia sp. ST3 TaxID=2824903 RepID=UPI001B8287AB|nr:hypothetical protein [Massilia sp. ST3]MBQ5947269.1 hypothetical protein [Massilia sp. ST3]